jgi:hypothetical protein
MMVEEESIGKLSGDINEVTRQYTPVVVMTGSAAPSASGRLSIKNSNPG